MSDADYDYSGHGPPPAAEDAEEPGEEEQAKLDAKKAEQLKRLTENHYDSDDEEVLVCEKFEDWCGHTKVPGRI